MEEAVGFPEMDAQFEAEGIPFSYIVTLQSGTDAGLAAADDCRTWGDSTGIGESMPILADPTGNITGMLPVTAPLFCALNPRMVILECWSGHNPGNDASLDPMIDVVRADWEANGG